jgi:spoIIIJ-associated protein
MEWVETTGKSVDEALDAALDQLGVADARIRARVRPTKPRAKEDRRDRRKRSGGGAGSAGSGGGTAVTDAPADEAAPEPSADAPDGTRAKPARGNGGGGRNGGRRRAPAQEEESMSETGADVPLSEQGAVAV